MQSDFLSLNPLSLTKMILPGALGFILIIILYGFSIWFLWFLITSIKSIIQNQKDAITNQKLELELLQKLLERKNNS